MREVSGVSAKILEEAVAGLAAVEAGEANLDDFLDFRLQYPELRRSNFQSAVPVLPAEAFSGRVGSAAWRRARRARRCGDC